METILSFISSFDPLLRYIVAGAVGAGAAAWAVLFIIFRRRFLSRLKEAFASKISLTPEITEKNSAGRRGSFHVL